MGPARGGAMTATNYRLGEFHAFEGGGNKDLELVTGGARFELRPLAEALLEGLVGRPPRAAAGPQASLCSPLPARPEAGQGAGCGPGGPPHQTLFSDLIAQGY